MERKCSKCGCRIVIDKYSKFVDINYTYGKGMCDECVKWLKEVILSQ